MERKIHTIRDRAPMQDLFDANEQELADKMRFMIPHLEQSLVNSAYIDFRKENSRRRQIYFREYLLSSNHTLILP